MNTRTRPVAAVAASRGLLWLSEVARDLDVDLLEIGWSDGGWRLRTATRHGMDVMGDRLGLAGRADRVPCRWGTWADMMVQIAGPVA